jgi:hypothetical protein
MFEYPGRPWPQPEGYNIIVPAGGPAATSRSACESPPRRRYREWYLRRGIPVFDAVQCAVRALGRIIRYDEFLDGCESRRGR